MTKMTVTEGLSEINLIKKKLESKRAKIPQLLFQVEHLPDPFLSEGGSSSVIQNELQSMGDLVNRLAKIRARISQTNLDHTITLNEMTQSIHDWLIWKREISQDSVKFVQNVNRVIKDYLDRTSKQPQVYKDEAGNVQLVKTKLNVNYPEWLKQEEKLTDTLEKLDGQLSLKNATLLIEV